MKLNITWLVKLLLTVMLAYMYMAILICWNTGLIPDSGGKWWLTHRDVMLCYNTEVPGYGDLNHARAQVHVQAADFILVLLWS